MHDRSIRQGFVHERIVELNRFHESGRWDIRSRVPELGLAEVVMPRLQELRLMLHDDPFDLVPRARCTAIIGGEGEWIAPERGLILRRFDRNSGSSCLS